MRSHRFWSNFAMAGRKVVAPVGPVVRSAMVSVRDTGGAAIEDRSWGDVVVDVLVSAAPWRTFRWYKGQKHYSAAFWSSTQRDHVIYESRLELAVLLLADFDPAVRGIVAQPFLLKAVVDGQLRRHVPDYLLLTDAGPVVVDVKPQHRLAKPEVAATLAWTLSRWASTSPHSSTTSTAWNRSSASSCCNAKGLDARCDPPRSGTRSSPQSEPPAHRTRPPAAVGSPAVHRHSRAKSVVPRCRF
jgi:hypothetical protein